MSSLSTSNANTNTSSMASSAHEQHSIKQRLAATNPNDSSFQDTQMSSIPDPQDQVREDQDEDGDGDDESRSKDHKLTKHNLKSIPDADELAPGIRLPAERLTAQDLNPNGNGQLHHHHHHHHHRHDDDQALEIDSGMDQHTKLQDGEEEVATVPPELDPRTAEFRPPSPSAASVFSVAVQAPGSPRVETALGDSTSSSSAFRNSSSSNSRPSSIRGNSPPLSSSSDAVSFSGRSTPASAGINTLNSNLARSSLSGNPNNSFHGTLTANSTGSQSFTGGPSLAPSEAGSSSSDSRSLSNSNSNSNSHRMNGKRNNRNSFQEGDLMEDDDDERVEVGSSNSKNSSSREGEFETDEDSEEVKLRALYIERQRMHERELMGGEAGVGGLSNLNSKGVLSYPFSAALRQEQEDSRNLNSIGIAGGSGSGFRLPSRAGSTTATVGTSSPPQSLSGVSSDYGDNERHADERLSRRGSTDTINSTGATSFKAPSFVDSNGRRASRSEVAHSPVQMDESA